LSYGDGCSSLQQHSKFEKEKKEKHIRVCVFLGLNFCQMEKNNQNSKK
jgi:hypothetical protein